jgi:hypothetical protein
LLKARSAKLLGDVKVEIFILGRNLETTGVRKTCLHFLHVPRSDENLGIQCRQLLNKIVLDIDRCLIESIEEVKGVRYTLSEFP